MEKCTVRRRRREKKVQIILSNGPTSLRTLEENGAYGNEGQINDWKESRKNGQPNEGRRAKLIFIIIK